MKRGRLLLGLLNQTPAALFAAVLLGFALLSPKFLTAANLSNIAVQSSSTAVVAIGMTFVLLTGGVDLSVGAVMFVAAAVAAKAALAGMPFGAAVALMLLVGAACGGLNALLVARLRLIPFVATLGTLYVGRGFSLWMTETRAMNLPEAFLQVGAARALGVPMPILIFGAALAIAHAVLSRTPYGRQVYAVGWDAEAARKAGVSTGAILGSVYIVSGSCAAVGALLSLGQLGAVSPTFGVNKEFVAIAAAVLGGTSLFGGRGHVFPGTVIGALLMQSVENGLNILNADPYLYPLVISGIIFVAVAVDGARSALLQRLSRRPIRRED
jgi:ribose transport system permease protein